MGRDPPVREAGVGTWSTAPRIGPLPLSHHGCLCPRFTEALRAALWRGVGEGPWSTTGAGPCRRAAPQLPPAPSTAT